MKVDIEYYKTVLELQTEQLVPSALLAEFGCLIKEIEQSPLIKWEVFKRNCKFAWDYEICKYTPQGICTTAKTCPAIKESPQQYAERLLKNTNESTDPDVVKFREGLG